MQIGIPAEISAGEKRVATVPEVVEKLTKLGFKVAVESGAGEGANCSDDAYRAAGAEIMVGAAKLWAASDIVFKVAVPTRAEVELMREGGVLIGFIWPAQNPELMAQLAAKKVTVLAIDCLPRMLSRAQKMDALTSQAGVAGYRAVLLVAAVLVGTSLFLTSRLTFNTDILGLLPRHDKAVQTYVQTLQDFGANTYLLVALKIPEGAVLEPYQSLADDLAGRLRQLPELKSVEHRLGDPQELLATFFPKAVLFLDAAGRDGVAARLTDERIRERARELRRESTPCEELLWVRLRDRQVEGVKFRRQVPLGPFIADFCCVERRLIVEVDGSVHTESDVIARDRERDDDLRGLGFRILRVTNEEVERNLDGVLALIRAEL